MCYNRTMKDTEIIILAAGKGSRMESEIPKVLVPLAGKPMINWVLETIQVASDEKPIIVIGYGAQQVKAACGSNVKYATQLEQKGTADAVTSAEPFIREDAKNILVAYGDQPFVTPGTLISISKKLQDSNLVIVTSVINDDRLFEQQFANFGRIIRDDEGNIIKIVEAKDATKEELAVREVNVGFMGFNKEWGFSHLHTLDSDNAQGELYLTDLVKVAFSQQLPINSVQVTEKEALGANTPEQLELMHTYL